MALIAEGKLLGSSSLASAGKKALELLKQDLPDVVGEILLAAGGAVAQKADTVVAGWVQDVAREIGENGLLAGFTKIQKLYKRGLDARSGK